MVPALTEVPEGYVWIKSVDDGSVVNAPVLSSFRSVRLFDGNASGLQASDGGRISSPSLVSVVAADATFDGTGTIDTGQIESWTNSNLTLSGDAPDVLALTDASGSTFTITGSHVDLRNVTKLAGGKVELRDGGTADLSNLTEADAASFVVSGGVTLSLPALTSYTHTGTPEDVYLQVSGAASVLDLSSVTTLTGSTTVYRDLFIKASAGGQVDLSGVTSIPGGAVSVLAEADGSNSVVDLSGLTGWTGYSNCSTTALEAKTGGAVHLSAATTSLSTC
jgi:hypothetical protein